MKHGVYLHLLYNLPWMHWMPWKNGRHPSHCCCEADDEDDAQASEEEEDEAGFHIPRWPWMVDIVA